MSFEQLLSRFPVLLPGAAFLVLGLVFLLFPPKRINGFYGYRTERSRRDIESWNFAQRHSAKAMIWTSLANMAVCLCGIDDPTYMPGEEWLGQLAAVAAMTAGSPHLKILLSHRAEYAGEYAKYDFDLVFSGHLHGGQWRIPGLGLGLCGPSAGGLRSGERHIFPRRAGGAYALENNATLVVSRGLARESAPLPRFFNHPELVVVNLKPQKPSAANP